MQPLQKLLQKLKQAKPQKNKFTRIAFRQFWNLFEFKWALVVITCAHIVCVNNVKHSIFKNILRLLVSVIIE